MKFDTLFVLTFFYFNFYIDQKKTNETANWKFCWSYMPKSLEQVCHGVQLNILLWTSSFIVLLASTVFGFFRVINATSRSRHLNVESFLPFNGVCTFDNIMLPSLSNNQPLGAPSPSNASNLTPSLCSLSCVSLSVSSPSPCQPNSTIDIVQFRRTDSLTQPLLIYTGAFTLLRPSFPT